MAKIGARELALREMRAKPTNRGTTIAVTPVTGVISPGMKITGPDYPAGSKIVGPKKVRKAKKRGKR